MEGGYTPIQNSSDGDIRNFLNIDGMVKLLYSTIMTDLGQFVESNILAFPKRTMDFANKTIQLGIAGVTASDSCNWQELVTANSVGENSTQCSNANVSLDSNAPLDPTAFYEWVGTGVPVVNASVISTQYLCEVPRLKSTGSLIVSVLVADLVFLQALWTIFNWAVTFFLQRRNKQANHCPECIAKPDSDESEKEHGVSSTGSYEQLPNPVRTPGSPIILPVQSHSPCVRSASIVSSLSLRRSNNVTAEPLLPSP